MNGLRTELHKRYKGQFITIVYIPKSTEEETEYNCKLEGKEKDLKNRKDSTGIDNIVINKRNKITNKMTDKRQLIPERIIEIRGQGKVVKPRLHIRKQLTSLQQIA